MLTLRVKGKYIMLVAALILVLAGMLYTAAVRAATLRELTRAEEAWDPIEYFRALTALFPNPEDAARELYFSASEDADGMPEQQQNMVVIFPTNTMSTPVSDEKEGRLTVALDKFMMVREHFPQTVWATHALGQLARVYYNLGNFNLMEEYALMAIEESNWEAATDLLARMYLDRGDARQALDLATESLRRAPGQLELQMMHIRGRALLALGEWSDAEEVFLAIPQIATDVYTELSDEDDLRRNNIAHWEEISRQNLSRIEALRQSNGKTGTITGKVVLGSEGMSGARVYLMDITEPRTYFSTAEMSDMRQAVSAADGAFVFDGVIPGRYVLGVAVRIPDVQGYTLRQQQEFVVSAEDVVEQVLQFSATATVREPLGGAIVEGETVFHWDEVEDAAVYDLIVTPLWRGEGNMGTYGTALRAKIQGNSVTIDMDEELQRSGFFPSYGHSDGRLNPYSVFGQLFPGGEFAWNVVAYDADGQRITDSTGYGSFVTEEQLPLFRIAGEMSAADELVWAGDYAKAIAAFEDRLQENPNDAHALLVLARIHQFGVHVGETDYKTAAKYYERLMAVEDSPEVRNTLANVYTDLGQHQKAYTLYLSLLGTRLEGFDTHFNLGKVEFNLGRPAEALTRLQRAVGMEYGQYTRAYPVALALVLGEEEQALTFANAVDGGERYLDLLVRYVAEGYQADDAFVQAVLAGNYQKARQLTGPGEPGQFLEVLLTTLEEGRFTDQPQQLTKEMNESLHKELLQSMFLYH